MKIGVLGGGQLGQMLAIAALPLNIEVSCFDTSLDAPARRPGKLTVGDLDIYSLRDWAKGLDVLTYEFENFPTELVSDLSEVAPLFPGASALATAQDRWAEKRLFDQLEISVGPFRTAVSGQDILDAIEDFDYPVIVKTRTGGYDGKGQVRVTDQSKVDDAIALLDGDTNVIVEKVIEFDYEVSVIGVRGRDGETRVYPITRNVHRDGILHTSTAPADVPASIATRAQQAVEKLLKHFEYVGVIALEMFVAGDQLLANEIAPRVHNSGHWTIEGAETSQFENHLRAVAGLPLGTTAARGPSAMVNLIGTTPPLDKMLAVGGASVHIYGKEPRPGRKLGHVTITGPSAAVVADRRQAIEDLL